MSAHVPVVPANDKPGKESAGLEPSALEPASLSHAGGAQTRSFPPTDGRPTAGTEPAPPGTHPGEPILQALQAAYDPGSASALIDLVEERWQEVEADREALAFLLHLVAQGHVIPADFSPEVGDAIRAKQPPLLAMQGAPRDATAQTRPVRRTPPDPDPAAKPHPAPTKVDLSARQDATTVDRRPMAELGPEHEIEGVTIEAKDETPWDRSKWKATGIDGMTQHYTARQHGRSFSIIEVGNMSGGNDHYYHDPALGQRWIAFSPPAPRDFTADLQAEIRRQQLLLDFVYDVGMEVYWFAALEGGGMLLSGLGKRIAVSASKVAAEGAEAAIRQARTKVTAEMAEEAAEEWISAGRRYYMELAGQAVEQVATGQKHHLLTNKVMRALDDHPSLRRAFRREDKRFQYPAKNLDAHNGYDQWHRDIDDEVVGWIKDRKNIDTTPREFVRYLHDLYQQPLHRSCIPNVNLMNIEP